MRMERIARIARTSRFPHTSRFRPTSRVQRTSRGSRTPRYSRMSRYSRTSRPLVLRTPPRGQRPCRSLREFGRHCSHPRLLRHHLRSSARRPPPLTFIRRTLASRVRPSPPQQSPSPIADAHHHAQTITPVVATGVVPRKCRRCVGISSVRWYSCNTGSRDDLHRQAHERRAGGAVSPRGHRSPATRVLPAAVRRRDAGAAPALRPSDCAVR